MMSPLEVYYAWQKHQRARDLEHMGEVVDLEGYTENCLGLTGWTIGYDVAFQNFVKNMITPWADRQTTVEEIIEGKDEVVIRAHIEATHIGEFLGIPATNRHIHWDSIAIVKVRDGRVIGQWAQPDLWGIYQQLTSVVPQEN